MSDEKPLARISHRLIATSRSEMRIKMKVYLYSGLQKLIEKSGVGRAIYHQTYALKSNNIKIVNNLNDADVIHINTVFPKSYIIAKRAKKKNIKVVYHAHSTKEDFKNSYIGSNLFDGLFGKWIKICYSTADIIVTPTPYSKRLLLSYGIKNRIEVISNGINTEYYDRDKVEKGKFRKRYGYSENDKIIMSVGLTIGRKGVIEFVELAKRMPEYKFVWFGETNLNTVPKKVRDAVRMSLPNLFFAGYADRDSLREAYADCDLFLFPSKEETEGIVVLEALAMKIPVLLRNIPVYDEWLEENKDVYKAYTTNDFEIKTKMILEGRFKSLVEQGHKVAEDRSLDKVGEKLIKVYNATKYS